MRIARRLISSRLAIDSSSCSARASCSSSSRSLSCVAFCVDRGGANGMRRFSSSPPSPFSVGTCSMSSAARLTASFSLRGMIGVPPGECGFDSASSATGSSLILSEAFSSVLSSSSLGCMPATASAYLSTHSISPPSPSCAKICGGTGTRLLSVCSRIRPWRTDSLTCAMSPSSCMRRSEELSRRSTAMSSLRPEIVYWRVWLLIPWLLFDDTFSSCFSSI
eukprot:2402928-Rhodomonas_salina.1